MKASIKPGVRLLGMHPAMSYAHTTVVLAFNEIGFECVMTAGVDGKHSRASKHYAGCAADYRTRHVNENQRAKLRDDIAESLGPEFDVILELEPPHLHVEWDPKDPLTA